MACGDRHEMPAWRTCSKGISMWIKQTDDQTMSPALRALIAKYRHQVFVELLKWDLQCPQSYEQDEFDRPGATHLVATDESRAVLGYARVMPTTGAYLLAKHFPHLLHGKPAPCDPAVWELSRFTSAAPPSMVGCAVDPESQTRTGKRLLLEVVRYVAAQGGHGLVFCTTVAIERLALRWGVEIQRLGPPQRTSAGLLVAAQIRCSARTLRALDDRAEHTLALASMPTPTPTYAARFETDALARNAA
jgi:acyl homoserine lactone synthase